MGSMFYITSKHTADVGDGILKWKKLLPQCCSYIKFGSFVESLVAHGLLLESSTICVVQHILQSN